MTTPTPKKTDIQTPELWHFPMDYPMSIIGYEGEHNTLLNEVTLILAEVLPSFDASTIQINPSKTGRFHALRLTVHLTCAEQVNHLYALLDKAKTVKTVI